MNILMYIIRYFKKIISFFNFFLKIRQTTSILYLILLFFIGIGCSKKTPITTEDFTLNIESINSTKAGDCTNLNIKINMLQLDKAYSNPNSIMLTLVQSKDEPVLLYTSDKCEPNDAKPYFLFDNIHLIKTVYFKPIKALPISFAAILDNQPVKIVASLIKVTPGPIAQILFSEVPVIQSVEKPFDLKMSIADIFGNTDFDYNSTVEISLINGELTEKKKIARFYNGEARLRNLVIKNGEALVFLKAVTDKVTSTSLAIRLADRKNKPLALSPNTLPQPNAPQRTSVKIVINGLVLSGLRIYDDLYYVLGKTVKLVYLDSRTRPKQLRIVYDNHDLGVVFNVVETLPAGDLRPTTIVLRIGK